MSTPTHVRELARHVGGVHHRAALQVGGRLADEIAGELVDIMGGWPPDAELLAWAADRHAALVEVFEHADPSFPYTWLPGPTPLTMWTRRQAHETAIHRVDAELAAGAVTPFEPELGADGVDELVLATVGNRRESLPVASPRTMHIVAADVDRAWTVVVSPEGFEVYGDRRGVADCAVRAPVGDLIVRSGTGATTAWTSWATGR